MDKGKEPRIKIDLSEWHLGDWPCDVGELVEMETYSSGVEIKINMGESYKALVRKIATEAIEAFFNETVLFDFEKEGLLLSAHEQNIMVPWDRLGIKREGATFKAAQAWLDRQYEEGLSDLDGDALAGLKRGSGRE